MDSNEQERLRKEVDEVLHGQRQPQEPTGFAQNDYSNIHHVIGVMSGKGGVGKSTVTASLAAAMEEDEIVSMSLEEV